jgi:hypothetical protein
MGNIQRRLKMCLGVRLSIAVQSVGGRAYYLVKVGTPVFGILLSPAGRYTLHKHLTVCNVLVDIMPQGTIINCDANVATSQKT